jgi:hypothetical protein
MITSIINFTQLAAVVLVIAIKPKTRQNVHKASILLFQSTKIYLIKSYILLEVLHAQLHYQRLNGVIVETTLTVFTSFFLITTSFYLTTVRLKGYCCMRSQTVTHTLGKTLSDEQASTCNNTQHSQDTIIHAQGGIRTCNPSKQAAAELLALK